MAQVAKVSAIPFREGIEFAVKKRELAVGGQLISLQALYGDVDDIYLPLYGDHQAGNAALALASVEAFAGVKLDDELVKDAFSKVTSPGRCEIVYRDPTVIIDAAHNPHGAKAIAKTINAEFDFEMVVGVVAVLAEKDAAGVLAELATCVDYLIVSQSQSVRAMKSAELAKIADVVRCNDQPGNQGLLIIDRSFERLWFCHWFRRYEWLDMKDVVSRVHQLKQRFDLRLAQLYFLATSY